MIDYIKTKVRRWRAAWRANPPVVDWRFHPKE